MNKFQAQSRQRGVTLIELVISIVIISIAMVAMLNSFSVLVGQSAEPLWRNKSLKLAQLYLDEILAKSYDDSTPLGGLPTLAAPSCASLGAEANESRTPTGTEVPFDDVDDYHGTIDSPPLSLVGSLDSSYDSYSVNVTVACDGSTVAATGTTPANNAKKITVVVTSPNGDAMTLAAYKGNY